MKRRTQNKEISFSAFSVEGYGEEPIKNWKGISLFWVRAVSEQRGAVVRITMHVERKEKYKATTRSARAD